MPSSYLRKAWLSFAALALLAPSAGHTQQAQPAASAQQSGRSLEADLQAEEKANRLRSKEANKRDKALRKQQHAEDKLRKHALKEQRARPVK